MKNVDKKAKKDKKQKKTKGGGTMSEKAFEFTFEKAFEQLIKSLGKEFKVEKKGEDKYEVKFGPYIFFVPFPYFERMAIFALLNCEQELLSEGYVEKIVDFSYEDYDLWDPQRLFDDEVHYTIYTSEAQDAIIQLKVKILYAPFSKRESKFRVRIKGWVDCYIPPV
jgi:hypothetical protein